jgi:thioredoxin 1
MSARRSVSTSLLVLGVAACSAGADPVVVSPAASPPPAASQRVDGLPRLVFFMNPNGVPCQLQDRVLRDLAPELGARAELVYYRTTEPADLPQFGRYGVRSLPMLLVTDAAGREVRRGTPGIHSADEIRRLLAP